MDSRVDSISSGNEKLDEMLGGGLPRNRSTLFIGGPGTGKSTIAMQTLQEGIQQGEECLYISTEQTPAELRDTFAPYDFDLTHQNLTITSVHARPGYTLDTDEEQLVIETLEGEELVGEGYTAPFSSKYITQLLGQYAPAERVVLDSVTGLRAVTTEEHVFHRAVIDLIRLFTDEFEATSLLLAESLHTGERPDVIDPLQHKTHGVVRLWRERTRGEFRHFIDVMKMRGVAHDKRSYEMIFRGGEGVDVIPQQRALPPNTLQQDRLSTSIGTFDDLLNGGFPRGDSVLLEHDGKANIDTLLISVATHAIETGMDMVLIPRVNTSPQRVDRLVAKTDLPFDDGQELLDADQLFVLDVLGAWENHRNVFDVQTGELDIEDQLQRIRDLSSSDGLFLVLNTEAKVHVLGRDQARRVRYWLQSDFLRQSDVLLDIHNPNLMASNLAEFYTDAATQVISTWLNENGIQYLCLEKATDGKVGGVRLVEYVSDPPFVRLE